MNSLEPQHQVKSEYFNHTACDRFAIAILRSCRNASLIHLLEFALFLKFT